MQEAKPSIMPGIKPGFQPHIEVRDLEIQYGDVAAVRGVSFDVLPGVQLTLLGPSGCGKTTVGRTLLRLTPATSGSVNFQGRDLLTLRGDELRYERREVEPRTDACCLDACHYVRCLA